MSLSWMREVPVSVSVPAVAGAILTRAAFRIRRARYPSVPRMVATSNFGVLEENEMRFRVGVVFLLIFS